MLKESVSLQKMDTKGKKNPKFQAGFRKVVIDQGHMGQGRIGQDRPRSQGQNA